MRPYKDLIQQIDGIIKVAFLLWLVLALVHH